MSASTTPLGLALAAAVASCSVSVWVWGAAADAALALVPGDWLLGRHIVWSVATFAFVEAHPVACAVALALLARLAVLAEGSAAPAGGGSARVASAAAAAVLG
jgi:hypothetical protein